MFVLGEDQISNDGIKPVERILADKVVEILHDPEAQESKAKGQGCGDGCKQTIREDSGCTIVLQVIIVVGILLTIILQNLAFLAMVGAGYLLYLIYVSCCLKTHSMLGNTMEGMEAVVKYIERVHAADPSFRWHIECWHYETKTRLKTSSKGLSRTKTERVKVVTHRASKTGALHSIDQSEKFIPDTSYTLTQLKSKVDITFAPGSNYRSSYSAWVSANKRDTHQSYGRTEFVSCHQKHALIEWVPGTKSCWMGDCCYFLSNVFLVSLVYRCVLNSKCGRAQYNFHKVASNIK